jgi:Domain of unknown function (DUF4129)
MAHGRSPAGGQGGPARPPGQPSAAAAASPRPAARAAEAAASSGLTARVALAALLVAVVLAGIGAAIPHTDWGDGPGHHQGTAVGVGLEAVFAVLLLAAERHRRRVPAVGQPAAGLRGVLRAGLIGGLVAIPVLILINAAGKFKIRPPRPLTQPRHRIRLAHLAASKPGHGFDLVLVLYAVIAALLLAAIVTCLILIWRRRGGFRGLAWADVGDIAEDEAQEQLREAVRSGRAALGEIDDARLAIIACYVAMEQSLAQAGAARADAETPDELLGRAATAGLVHGGEAARLTTLFYEARYSTHPLPDERRDEARRALEVLAASLRQRPEPTTAEQASAGEAR